MKKLDEAVLVEPITSVNFFNGRVLSAEDLRAERKATRRRVARLGRAAGSGVVDGLLVRRPSGATGPVVQVSAGLAIDGAGEPLELAKEVDLTLSVREEPTPAPRGPDFDGCDPTSPDLLMARGAYLLLICPTEQLSVDRAPRAGLGLDGRAFGCEARHVLEGVRFRLVKLELVAGMVPELTAALISTLVAGEGPSASAEARSLRRNLLAHLFFGTLARRDALGAPFRRDTEGSPFQRYGLLDELKKRKLIGAREVPLALLGWRGASFDFIDNWAVRRGLTPPARSPDWPTPGDHRGVVEREAAFHQFQRHLADLTASGHPPTSVEARRFFRFLPAVGYLPLAARTDQEEAIPFFQGLTVRRPTFADQRLLDGLYREGLEREAIDLEAGELIWLYVPWQVAKARSEGSTTEPVLVFAGPHTTEQGVARFDVARWDWASYAR